jgi:small-conductance mechanosensitive channel
MSDYFNSDTTRIIIATASFIALLVIVFFIYRYVFKILRRKVSMAPGKLDGFILNLFKVPALWFIYWVLLEIFIHFFLKSLSVFSILLHINAILLIFSIAWISIQFIKAGSYYLQNKLNIGASDNLRARKSLTQIKVFKGIANTLIIIISIAIGLLTFEQVRSIGISLLTSAGIFGIIIGFAAQKSIGMILAGIQIAITQPIRLDDVVIVEGEWGRIEEITLTYVVVKIWDERRLVMPVTSFLEKPFQNWTRTNSAIMGTVFLYVDYSFPVDAIRKILPDMVKGNSDWDGRVLNVQVTKASEQCKEIRILLSSTDASKNWDLRADIREKLIDFINVNYPDTFAKIRIKTI